MISWIAPLILLEQTMSLGLCLGTVKPLTWYTQFLFEKLAKMADAGVTRYGRRFDGPGRMHT